MLTAAVVPAVGIGVAISDPALRRAQYREAVAEWARTARTTASRLAVVETSGADMDDVVGGHPVELIHYSPPSDIVRLGKGAIEAAALDHALDVLGFDEDVTVVKSTGRLLVSNASHLIAPTAPGVVRVRRSLDRRYCDTRFFVTTSGCWRRHLKGMAPQVDDGGGVFLEHVMAKRLIDSEFVGEVNVERFPRRPAILGVSGTSGHHYGGPTVARPVQHLVEQLAQRLVRKQV